MKRMNNLCEDAVYDVYTQKMYTDSEEEVSS